MSRPNAALSSIPGPAGKRRAVTGTTATAPRGLRSIAGSHEAITGSSEALTEHFRAITGAREAFTGASGAITEALRAITGAFNAITGERARSMRRTLGAFSDGFRAGVARGPAGAQKMWRAHARATRRDSVWLVGARPGRRSGRASGSGALGLC